MNMIINPTKSNDAALLVTVSLRIHERDAAGMGRNACWSTLNDLSIRITQQRKTIPDALAAAISLGWIERVADLYATTPAGRAAVAAEQRKPRAVAAEVKPAPVPFAGQHAPKRTADQIEARRRAIDAAPLDEGKILTLLSDGRGRTAGDVLQKLPAIKGYTAILRSLVVEGLLTRGYPQNAVKMYVYKITPLGMAEVGGAAA
jgi:hypothetical protein